MLVEDTTLCVLREEFVSSISLMDLRLNVQVVDEKPLCLEDRLARKSHCSQTERAPGENQAKRTQLPNSVTVSQW